VKENESFAPAVRITDVGRPEKDRAGRGRAATDLRGKLAVMASGTVGSMALTITQSIVVARLLGPRELASYAAVSVAALLSAQLNDWGLANAFAYYARRHPAAVRSLLRVLRRHLITGLLLTTAVGILGTRLQIGGIRDVFAPPWFVAVLVAFVTLGTAAAVLPVFVLARGRYSTYVAFTNGTVLLQLSFIIIAYAVAGASWRAFITAAACAQAVIVALEFRFISQHSKADREETISARECYGYGLRIKWAEVMKLLSGRIDLLVVAAVLPAAQVGVYSLVLGLREFGMAPLRAYAGILQNLLVDRERTGQDSRGLVLGSLILQSGLSLALCAGAVVCFPFLLPAMYGSRFAGAIIPAILAVCGTAFLSIAGLCWTVFNMSGRPEVTSAIVTVAGVIAPPLVFVLAQSHGLNGAAFAGVLTAGITCALSLIVLMRQRHYRMDDLYAAVGSLRKVLADFRAAAPSPVVPSPL
jgi:O-antigen/teichoic acid export membrane protein